MSASEAETEIQKRLYVGGLSKGVTEDELKQRFELFVKVPSIHVKFQADSEGNHVKTFAHLDVQGTESGLKKLYNAYQNAKWRGSVVKLEDAKESFLDRLTVERQEEKKKQIDSERGKSKKRKVEEWKTPDLDKLKVVPVPGTPVPGKKDWVVGKYGRVLPVLNVKKSYVTKAVKHDPSKFCHASKVYKEDDGDTSRVNCDTLTWEIDQPDSEITKKRKGEFPVDARPKKKLKVLPVEVSKSTPVKDKCSNKSSPKEHFADRTFPKENSTKSREIHIDPSSGIDDEGSGAVTDDGLEIVKVGGKYQSQKKCAVRSRFDSDYESDSGDNAEQSIKVNNKNNNNDNVKAKHVKSSKKRNISTDPCDISKNEDRSSKKIKLSASFTDKEQSEGENEIPKFKGIGSLVARPDVASPGKKNSKQNKTLPDHTKKTVCNGVMSSDKEKKEAETNSKNKRKKEPLSDLQKSSLIRVKKPGDEENSLSAMQQNASQYADLLLSEFVANAPQNRPQFRQKYDPYDSDLDSDNFELVAKKLAKKAGIETGGKKSKQPVNHDKEYMNNRTNGEKAPSLTNLMFSLAGGYSPGRKATTAVAESNHTQVSSSLKTIQFDSDSEGGAGQTKRLSEMANKIPFSRDKKDSPTSKKTISKMNGNKVEESKDKKRVEDSSDEEEENSNNIGKNMKTVSGGENKQNVKDNSHEKDDTSEEDGASDEENSSDNDVTVKNKKKIDIGKAKKKNEDSDEDDSSHEEESSDEVVQNLEKAGGEEPKKKIQESSEGDSDSSDEEEEEEGESSSEEDDICDKIEKKEKSVNGKSQEVEDGSSEEDDDDEEESSDDEEENSNKKVDERKDKKSTEGDSNDEEEESSDDEEEESSNDEEEESSDDEEESSNKKVEKIKKKVDERKDKKSTEGESNDEEEESSDDEEEESSDDEEEYKMEEMKKKVDDKRNKDRTKDSSSSSSSEEDNSSDEEDSSEKVQIKKKKTDNREDGKKTVDDNSSDSDEEEDDSSDEEEDDSSDEEDDKREESETVGSQKILTGSVKPVPGGDAKITTGIKRKASSSSSSDEEEVKDDNREEEAQEVSLAEEKLKNLKVLENVVGKDKVDKLTAKLKKNNVFIMDMNQLRFDPTKLQPSQIGQKDTTTKKTKTSFDISFKKEVHIKAEPSTPGEVSSKDSNRKRDKKQEKERDMNQGRFDPPKLVSPKTEPKTEKTKSPLNVSVKKEVEAEESESDASTYEEEPPEDKTRKRAKKQKKERDMNEQEGDSPTTPAPSKEVTAKQKKKEKKKKAEDRESETQDSTKDVPLNDQTLKQDKKLKKGRVAESATRSAVTVSDLFMNALKSGAHSVKTDKGQEKSVGEASSSSFSLLDMFDEEEPMDTDSQPPVKPLSALPDPSKHRGSQNSSTGSNKTVEEENENRNVKIIEEMIPKFKVIPQGSKDMPITSVTTTDTAPKKTEAQKKELKRLKEAHDEVLRDAGRADVRFSKDDWKAKNTQIRQNILKICKNRNSFAIRKKKTEEFREKGKAVRRFGSWEK